MKRDPPRHAHRQHGAALLMGMVTVALVATLAAGMVWQQWRAIQVEAAERARAQAGWVLLGALDWARLILREDGRAGAVDHLGEPWATPLAEARLSTFLAADREGSTDGGPEAFLSGSIADAQARYNLRNLVGDDGKVVATELKTLARLCESAGLATDVARRLADALAGAWTRVAVKDAGDEADRPLPVSRFDHLVWLGLDSATVDALRPHADVLPIRTPINVNTASRDVIAAVLDIDPGTAQRLVQARQRAPLQTVDAIKAYLPEDAKPDPKRMAVATSHFEVSGRLRLDERVLEEYALMQRRGTGSATEVVTLRRERRSLHAELR